ncbi:MAG: CAP domain-containing protein [Acidobacteria bacterium]|nr:CAP domain-containing protein [Acidobacteriota bacterium]
MTFDNSSPDTRARVRLPRPLPALPLFFFFALVAFAAQTKAQSGGARPVARLVATTTAAPSASAVTSSARCESRTRYAHSSSFGATSAERRAFDLVNRERAARGEAQLAWDDSLARMARDHSEEMAHANSLTHQDSAGRDTFARAADEGVCGWRALGENIAYNQGFEDPVAFAVERWMQSPKHRENILRAAFTHAAVGIAKSADGSVYFTQVFVTR